MNVGKVYEFLRASGWHETEITPLQADFSPRKFARLKRWGGKPESAVLMQAGPDQKTPQFLAISGLLRRCGLSAPEIYAADAANGLVLMEDLGDSTFGSLLDAGYGYKPLYRRAIEVLARLHGTFAPEWAGEAGLPVFDSARFVEQAGLFLDCYFVHARKRAATEEERESFNAAWEEALKPMDSTPSSLILRDFMPDNLMDLPGREGTASVGILDFQDGGEGPAAYDIASLCECVRRAVPQELLDEAIGFYRELNPAAPPPDELRRVCCVLSAQRHTRVLGIAARLAPQESAEKRLSIIPRVLGHLKTLLREPVLKPVKLWFDRNL